MSDIRGDIERERRANQHEGCPATYARESKTGWRRRIRQGQRRQQSRGKDRPVGSRVYQEPLRTLNSRRIRNALLNDRTHCGIGAISTRSTL